MFLALGKLHCHECLRRNAACDVSRTAASVLSDSRPEDTSIFLLRYVIKVDRTQDAGLGIEVNKTAEGRLKVLLVQPGLVQDWNDAHPSLQAAPLHEFRRCPHERLSAWSRFCRGTSCSQSMAKREMPSS